LQTITKHVLFIGPGINGAGKTSTMNMLTGSRSGQSVCHFAKNTQFAPTSGLGLLFWQIDRPGWPGNFLPSAGDAWLDGLDIKTQQMEIRAKLGYCPQHDALLDLLTVREHLELFGRIKGVPEKVRHHTLV
jgi:ABC-type multidrug transport system ATPase subunit